MLRDLREGWSEFRSQTWLWVIGPQFAVILMAWYGSFAVLGPAVVRAHLGVKARRLGSDHRRRVARPDRGRAALAAVHPASAHAVRRADWRQHRVLAAGARDALAAAADLRGVLRARHHAGGHDGAVDGRAGPEHPAEKLARVSSYDALGVVMAMPAGAVVAGPIARGSGCRRTQYGAAALIVIVSVLALIPRDIRDARRSPHRAPRQPRPRLPR